MDNYRPPIISPEPAAKKGAALTPVPPQPAALRINPVHHQAQLQASQQQMQQTSPQHAQTPQQQMPLRQMQQQPPFLPAELQMMPPPHYSVHDAGMPQQHYNPMVQPQPAIPAEVVKVPNQNSKKYKVQCKASYSICTGKGIPEIAARIGVIVSLHALFVAPARNWIL